LAPLVLASGSALALPVGLFELDGNVADNLGAGDDWENVYLHTDSALATAFISDGVRDGEDTFFTGGGSKDTNDVTQWLYATSNDVVPDKDDIEHAFAAAYADPVNKDLIFYFGADRLDPGEGSAQIGFWFFRNSVGLVPIGAGKSTGKFTGQHANGDILVLLDFLKGGSLGAINVYKWQNGAPVLIANPPAGSVFAIDNVAGGENPPWPYDDLDTNGDGVNEAYQPLTLFEGGINLTQLGVEGGCFSSFLAETRSSGSSLDAQLKDFAAGQFPLCGLEVTKSGPEISKRGDTVGYTVTIRNVGLARLYQKSILDSRQGDLTGQGSCGASLAKNDGQPGGPDECTIQYNYTIKAGDPDPLVNKVTALYTERADFTGVQITADAAHTVDLFQPSISLAKQANKTEVFEGEQVIYTITLNNTSSAGTPDLDCTVRDAALGIEQPVTGLVAGTSNLTVEAHAWTSIASNPACAANLDGSYTCTNTATVECGVEGFSNRLAAEASAQVVVRSLDGTFTVSKDGDEYSKGGDMAHYSVTISNVSSIALEFVSISDSLAGDLKASCPATLAASDGQPGGPDECVIEYDYTVKATDATPLANVVTVTMGAAGNAETTQASKDAQWGLTLLKPGVDVAKSCTPKYVLPGEFVSFWVDVTNTGDADLVVDVTDTMFGQFADDMPLPVKDSSCLYGGAGDNVDGCMRFENSYQMGEQPVTNTATVVAGLDDQYGELPNQYQDSASATCKVRLTNSPTRTLGFWKTHGSDGTRFDAPVEYGYTCYVAQQLGVSETPPPGGGFIDLGWKKLFTCGDVFGMFWAIPGKCSTAEDRARINPSWQFLAALLNQQAFNTAIPNACKGTLSGVSDEDLFEMMRTALKNNDVTTYKQLAKVFGCYNEAGDYLSIVDTVPVPHADPNGTRAEATNIAHCGR
jgi:hypothetical protein